MEIKHLKNEFNEVGFLINKNFWNEDEITKFHESFYELLIMQGKKISIDFEKINNQEMLSERIINLSRIIESKNRNAFNQLIQMQREMYLNNLLVYSKKELIELSSFLLSCDQKRLKIHQDGCLVNFPKNSTRLYRYHSEQNYYPFRKNFINIWFPLVNNKNERNGTMMIRPKGHKRNYEDFVEFSGYSEIKESNSMNEEKDFYQLNIPDIDLNGLDEYPCELNVGDAIIFHQNLPHTSTINKTKIPSFAYILRIYDFSKDRTLGNYNGIKKYSSDAAKNAILNPEF